MTAVQKSPKVSDTEFIQVKEEVDEISKILFKGNGKKPLLVTIELLIDQISRIEKRLDDGVLWQKGILAAVIIAIVVEILLK